MAIPIEEILGVVVDYHRDRDEEVWQSAVGYLVPTSKIGRAETREAFEAAVKLLVDGAAVAPAHQPLSSEYFPPRILEFLEGLDPVVRTARLDAVAYTQRLACQRSVAAMKGRGIASTSRLGILHPELCSRVTNRDFLLPVADGVTLEHTWLRYKETAIHCHPAVHRDFRARRGNGELIGALNAAVQRGVRVAVAVDSSRVCPANELYPVLEADRWFGRPFNHASLDDLSAVGRTVLARNRSLGHSTHESAGLLTEIRWTSDGVLKNFELEELPVVEDGSAARCRFVHAIRNTTTKQFIHLDGALHEYSSEEYALRKQQVFASSGKVYGEKLKLFRLDLDKTGIEAEDWSLITQSFFRGNELVLEYFSDRTFDQIYRETYGCEYPYPS